MNKVSRTRLMITFEDEIGYKFLLDDLEELEKLKPNSYLDLPYLERYNKYRVHLYYKDNKRRRIIDLENKYPLINKVVDLDDDFDIRLVVDENNSLSKAIFEIHKSGIPPLERPQQELLHPVEKKVKTRTSDDAAIMSNKKTKSELIRENSSLKVDLRSTLRQLTDRECELISLKNKTQKLLSQQEAYESLFKQVIQKLSPTTKELLLQVRARCGQEEVCVTNTFPEDNKNQDDFWIDSPRSIQSSEKEVSLQKQKSSPDNEIIEEMDHSFQGQSHKRSITENSTITVGVEVDEINLEKKPERQDDHDSVNDNESSFFQKYDEAIAINQTPRQSLIIEHQPKPQKVHVFLPKKTVEKKTWNGLTNDVFNVMTNMKKAIQSGATEEDIQKDKVKYPNKWRTVLRDYYEKFRAFLQSS